MTGNSTKIFMAKRMESIFRREDIMYAAECRISAHEDEQGKAHYTPEIQEIIDKQNKVFGLIPPVVPLERGFEHII
jgi:hypothetical protein